VVFVISSKVQANCDHKPNYSHNKPVWFEEDGNEYKTQYKKVPNYHDIPISLCGIHISIFVLEKLRLPLGQPVLIVT
jgi:hypothetical protein